MAPKRKARNVKYNKLLPQEFACSDLPKSFFKNNFFSCSACDDWRLRVIHGRRNTKASSQDELRSERMRCQRSKRGRKPIRFRVIVPGEAKACVEIITAEEAVTKEPAAEATAEEAVTKEPAAEATAIKKKMTKKEAAEAARDLKKVEDAAAAKAALCAKKDDEAATVRRRLMKAMQNKQAAIKKKNDEVIVSKAVEAFNKSMMYQLTSHLADALVDKSKYLALESQLNMEQRRRLQAEEALSQEKLTTKRLRHQITYYKKQLCQLLQRKNVVVATDSGTDTLLDSLCERIEDAFGIMKGAHAATNAAKLLELISTGLLFNGTGISMLESMHRDYIRNKFSPWKLVFASDMSPAGSFRTATVSGLSEFFDTPREDEADDSKPKSRMFPSASTVSRERQALNKYALNRIGLTRKDTPYGEIYYADPERAIRLLLEAAGLTEFAQQGPVHLAVTSDGANSFHNRTQISIGIKVVDTRGHHCKTKMPIFVRSLEDDLEDDGGHYQGVQSSEMCTICIMADARDKSKMYAEVFSSFYKYTESLMTEGMPASEHGPFLYPMKVSYPSDLKAIWTTSGRGGNCKKTNFFCHLCSATRHDLVSWKEGSKRCKRCLDKNKRKCYHHQVCDSTTVEALLSDLENSLEEYLQTYRAEYEEIIKKSELLYDHMMALRYTCEKHIDYLIPGNDAQKASQYASFIVKECRLRGIPINFQDGVEEWRDQLRASVAMESKIALLMKVRQWKNEGVLKVPLVLYVELLIPCILHMENRVGEKILTMILRKGLELWSGSPRKKFIEQMEAVFQQQILGTAHSPAHWSLPHEGKNDAEIIVSKISGRNEMIRHMIRQSDTIIESSLPAGHPLQQKLIQAIQSYRNAMKMLNSHRNLSEDEVEQYQDYADEFLELWVEVFGSEGITNYIHLIGSGHMQYFLKNYGCLYLYSQQGWEALIGKVQAVLHLNTQRGGKGSGEGKTKSFIYPVMLYILRDLLWKTGDARRFFLNREQAKSLRN